MATQSTSDERFSFLITTDNHLGYKEDDHIRRKDSFYAFREALALARARDVDFILLGGDLFHVNKPSAAIEHKCMKIIREHMNAKCSRGTSFRRISGAFSHFNRVSHANFEDPNFTIPYPIMTIHGNHDDPTGSNAKSVCEKLATCGLINYFGALKLVSNASKKTQISVEPIVLEKGALKIALYGIGFIPDFKLKQAFDRGEVKFQDPPKDSYNVLVIHQNRVPLNKQKYIPDEILPNFFHLIIRGHEHNTMAPEPDPNSKVGGLIYQPGSTVATSMSPLEAAPKSVGIFKVEREVSDGDKCSLYKQSHELIELRCQRRMIFENIYQKELFKYMRQVSDNAARLTTAAYRRHSYEYVSNYTKKVVEDYNQDIEKTGRYKESKMARFKLPLVRVRVEFVSREERFDELQIGNQLYPNHVANKDIVLFRTKKVVVNSSGVDENVTFVQNDDDEQEHEEFDFINLGEEKRDTVDAMILNYFRLKPPHERLVALSLDEYTRAVRSSNDEGNVISKVLAQKKKEVLSSYQLEILDAETCRKRFSSEDQVREWFLKALKMKNCDMIDSTQHDAKGINGKREIKPEPEDLPEDWDDDIECLN